MIRRFDPVRIGFSLAALFRQALSLVALWIAFFPGGSLWAERVAYAADEVMKTTTVNTSSLTGRSVTLDEVFALVESQTKLKFFYVSNRISTSRRIVFQSGGTLSLAQLFSDVSSLANVVFERDNLKIIVRGPLPGSDSSSGTSGQPGPAPAAH